MLSKLWIFSVSSAASVGNEHISNETLQSHLCGAGPAPETPSLQLLAYSATADSQGIAQRTPSQRKRSGGFIRVVICSDLLQTLSLTVHCLQASNCSLSTSQPCRYTMEGSATMLPLPRVLPAQLPGVGKDSETQGSLMESAAMAEAMWQ